LTFFFFTTFSLSTTVFLVIFYLLFLRYDF
jgi:hypothetical protein